MYTKPNRELTPTTLVNFKRWLVQCDKRFRKRFIQNKLNFGDVVHRMSRSEIAAPLVSFLTVRGSLAKVYRVSADYNRSVNDFLSLLHLF